MKKYITLAMLMLMSIGALAQTDSVDQDEDNSIIPAQRFVTRQEVDYTMTHPPQELEDSLGYVYLYHMMLMEKIDAVYILDYAYQVTAIYKLLQMADNDDVYELLKAYQSQAEAYLTHLFSPGMLQAMRQQFPKKISKE